jgi:tRNA threonylcarbamoyladenosine biosynthesis protein TsaE
MNYKDTSSPEETIALGCCIGEKLQSGDVVCLTGDLGAGKTHLSKGIAQGLGIVEAVTSPTYTILQVYQGRIDLYHFDLYRLERPDQLEDIGFDECVYGHGVTLIEWADKFMEVMPQEYMKIRIEYHGHQSEGRRILVEAFGSRYQSLLEELKHTCMY